MTDAEKWKKVEPLLKRLATEAAEADESEEILDGLTMLAGQFWSGLTAPHMLPDREVVLRLPSLRDLVNGLILNIAANGAVPKDSQQFIFERAVETFYGNNIWDWYNKVVQ